MVAGEFLTGQQGVDRRNPAQAPRQLRGCPSLAFSHPSDDTRVDRYRQNIVAEMTGMVRRLITLREQEDRRGSL
jgi:hypothetical protein